MSTTTTKRAGGEKRGNSYDRRRRKEWMLEHFGDGTTCLCIHCLKTLAFDTLEADRIVPGGSYRRENIQPACRECNLDRSDNPDWVAPLTTATADYRPPMFD